MHTLFQEIQAQLSFALAPSTPSFSLFQPDSVFTPASLGMVPWTLAQLDGCLATHTDNVVSFISCICLQALSLCSRRDVVVALCGAAPNDYDETLPPMQDDWPGHPQRKDYPLGGIDVEFKGATNAAPQTRRSYA